MVTETLSATPSRERWADRLRSPARSIAAITGGRMTFLLDVLALSLWWPLIVAAGGVLPERGLAFVCGALLPPAVFLLSLYALGLYRRDTVSWTRLALRRLPWAVLSASIAAYILLIPLEWAGIGLAHHAPLLAASMLAFTASGTGARLVFFGLKRAGAFRSPILVIGAGARAADLIAILRTEGRALLYDATFVHDPSLGAVDPRLQAAGSRILPLTDMPILATARRLGAEQIVVAPDERRGMLLEPLLACKTAGFPVLEYLTFLEREVRRVDMHRMQTSWLLYSEGFQFDLLDRLAKRALDLVVSLLLLLLFAPLLLPAMLAVKLCDPGPVFYRQERITRGGRPFRILKLRTMRVDAERDGAVWAAARDPRITRVGAFLRRTRIDEMPQLFNVLRGEMSLVGPRPERPAFVAMLARELPFYAERHTVKAGLTGWAQINYPYGASIEDARSKLSYDLYYVKNFSVVFDLLILLQTVRVVLFAGSSVR